MARRGPPLTLIWAKNWRNTRTVSLSQIFHPIKYMKKIIPLLIAAFVLTGTGCRSLMQGAAEEPYVKAVKDGRMSPTEYRKQTEEIRKASQPSK